MPVSDPLTRARPSLSCALCRRRKVRCSKEQPACHNCVRTNEVCEYDGHAWKASQAKANQKQQQTAARKQKSSSSGNGPTSRGVRDTIPPDRDWVAWTGQALAAPPPPSHLSTTTTTTRGEGSTVRELSSERSLLDRSTRAASPTDESGDSANLQDHGNFSDVFTSNNTSEPYFPQHLGRSGMMYDGGLSSSTTTSWTTTMNPEGLTGRLTPQRHMQLLSPGSSTVCDSQFSSQLHQPATSTARALSQGVQAPENNSQPKSLNPVRYPGRPDSTSDKQTLPNSSTQIPHRHPGYLSVRSGARVRYVGSAFWAYIKGTEPICDSFLGGTQEASDGLPQPHINSPALAHLLALLPPKPACDALLHSFLIGVRPINPLIHVPTMRSDYNDFWHWYQNMDTELPPDKLVDDPTFLCLLFTILNCGATMASAVFWVTGALQNLKRQSTIDQLENASSTSLKLVQHLRFPTFNTLVASLLMHGCLRREGRSSDDSDFVNAMVRVAYGMGLHIEASELKLDAVTCEMRRRVWWYILWLDLQHSIFKGLPMFCHYEAPRNVAMVSERRDKDIAGPQSADVSTPLSGPCSASMLFAIGRFETARVERSMVNHLHSARGAEGECLEKINDAVKSLHITLSRLISRMPTQGVPEKGMIPSRLANASPLGHQELYMDHANRPTVFTSWTRITLTMLKNEAAILLERMSLQRGSAKSNEGQSQWNRVIQLCTSYLSNFLQLIHVPAFAPYTWFCFNYFGPLQAVFLTLTYFEDVQDSEAEIHALYLVDETIDFFVSENDSHHSSAPGNQDPESNKKNNQQMESAWTKLKALRRRLPSHLDCQESRDDYYQTPTSFSASSSEVPPSQVKATRGMHSLVAEPNNMAGSSKGGGFECDRDVNMILDNSSLDIWSSSLIQDSNGPLSPEQYGMGRPDHDMSPFQSFSKAPTPAATPMAMGGARAYLGKPDWMPGHGSAKEAGSRERASAMLDLRG